jgi:hypothetical protein
MHLVHPQKTPSTRAQYSTGRDLTGTQASMALSMGMTQNRIALKDMVPRPVHCLFSSCLHTVALLYFLLMMALIFIATMRAYSRSWWYYFGSMKMPSFQMGQNILNSLTPCTISLGTTPHSCQRTPRQSQGY